MTATVEQASGDLEQYLPVAAALIPIPDTTPGPGTRTAPGSRPPGNQEASTLVHGIVAGLAGIETSLRQAITGTTRPRRPYRQTGAALKTIARLAPAAGETMVADAARWMDAQVTAIRQLRAVDAEDVPDRPVRVRSACPYCHVGMLRLLPRTGRVTCLRFGVCADGNGEHPRGVFEQSSLDGQWRIYWRDGGIT